MYQVKKEISEVYNEIECEENDVNAKKCMKNCMLKDLGKDYNNKRDLFKVLFLHGMDDIEIDDKIVMLFGEYQYDINRYEKKINRKGIDISSIDIEKFANTIYTKIKEVVIKGLEYVKDKVLSKIISLIDVVSNKLKIFIQEQGTKLIEKVIDLIRNGKQLEDITVIDSDDNKVNLISYMTQKDIDKFNKLVDDVDKLYDKTYDKISDDVYAIKNNIEISNSKLCCK